MNYEKLVLDALERDLVERRDTGALEVVFKGGSAEHRIDGELKEAAGVPPEVLAYCVRSIFTDTVDNPTIWRGFSMSNARLVTKISAGGVEAVDMLTVSLNLR